MTLNSNYFEFVHSLTSTVLPGQYQVYRPNHAPLVLTSRDGTPLASVGIMYTEHTSTKPLIVHRPKGEAVDFQCLFPVEGKQFQWLLTNLTSGMIKIDIGRSNVAVDEVDPGASKGYVNSVNEIHSFQTVEIKGDQKDSLAFVIGALKTTSGQKITVKEAESSPKKKGTFYYLSVTPRDNDTYLHPLFKDTYWHVPEYITIKGTLLREESYEGELFEENDEGDAFFEPASIEESYESRPAFIHACSYESRPASRPAPTISDDVKKIMMYNIEKVIERGQRLDTISYGYAAEVTTGEHVDTRSNFTSFQYLYDVSSNQSGKLCCVSLSIAPALVHGTPLTKSEIIELAKNDFTIREQGVTQSLMEEMIKKGIFKEDVCVVCQEDIPPNVILYRCGHQCLHKTCIGPQTRCPMCRSPIVASIDASLAPN